MKANKVFRVNWERVITEAFGPWDYGWIYNPEDWDFMVIVSGSSENDLIKLKDAVATQAKEQGII
jgi:hypothetical protein